MIAREESIGEVRYGPDADDLSALRWDPEENEITGNDNSKMGQKKQIVSDYYIFITFIT